MSKYLVGNCPFCSPAIYAPKSSIKRDLYLSKDNSPILTHAHIILKFYLISNHNGNLWFFLFILKLEALSMSIILIDGSIWHKNWGRFQSWVCQDLFYSNSSHKEICTHPNLPLVLLIHPINSANLNLSSDPMLYLLVIALFRNLIS